MLAINLSNGLNGNGVARLAIRHQHVPRGLAGLSRSQPNTSVSNRRVRRRRKRKRAVFEDWTHEASDVQCDSVVLGLAALAAGLNKFTLTC